MKHRFELVKGRPVPRDQRWVETPIEDCKEVIVSDICPTDAVSLELIDSIGTAKYGEIEWATAPTKSMLDDFILRKITRSNLPGFSRLWFSRNIPESEKGIPYKTEKKWDRHFWHPILLKVRFLEVPDFPHSARDVNNNTTLAARRVVREDYIPSQDCGTLHTIEHFVSDTPTDIPAYIYPMPSSVAYDFLGIDDFFESCLHPDLKFDAQRNALIAYDSGNVSTSVGGSIAGQFFPATNMEDWQTHCIEDGEVKEEILYHRTRIWVDPPDQPEPSRR